jgi:hypothetical protein
MANAKHLDRIRQREHESLVRKCEKAEKHEEMLKQHKEWKKRRNSGFIDKKEAEAAVELIEDMLEVQNEDG